MTEISRTTNWDDPVAAKKANDQIQEFLQRSLQLQAGAKSGPEGGEGKPAGGPSSGDAPDLAAEGAEYKAKLWGQMMKLAADGEDTDPVLAEPFRKEWEEEESARKNAPLNPAFVEAVRVLTLDFSTPQGGAVAEHLDQFANIRVLILTGGPTGAPVALEAVLAKASRLPLEELWIVNFRGFVTSVPTALSFFPGLTRLALFNNAIRTLPPSIGRLSALTGLYVDANPIAALLPAVEMLRGLEELGVAKTKIPAAELSDIAKKLPNCRILTE